jgi:orotidine-5'-phosphate decarboxylase
MILKKIIVALDCDDLKYALNIVKALKKEAFAFKIGYEFFFNFGLEGYKIIEKENIRIFLDLKLHDIPNTVKKGISAISKLNPYFTTIHLSGGDEMQIAANTTKKNTRVLGVSILTSLNSMQTQKFYFNKDIEGIVSNFTNYALSNKLDGIVCSPKEIKIIKKISLNKLLIITPGIRPTSYKKIVDDQQRTMTPKEAIDAGANYLVIGRPITQSSNPLKELKSINLSIE